MDGQTRAGKWVETARWAASGGNAQPWHVRVETVNSLTSSEVIRFTLRIDPSRRLYPSPMEVNGVASLMALGCFSFCLETVARNDEFQISNSVLRSGADLWGCEIEIEFSAAPGTRSRFQNDDIKTRRTDRGKMSRDLIEPSTIEKIERIISGYPDLEFWNFRRAGKPSKQDLLPALQKIERVRWRSPIFLSALLDELVLAGVIAETGIPLADLGVSRLDQRLLAQLKGSTMFQRVFGFIARMGADHIAVQKATRDFVNECDCVGFISIKPADTDLADFDADSIYRFGRCFQEIWLEVTRRGLSFQPLALPLIALSYWCKSEVFSPRDAQRIERATKEFRDQTGIDLKLPVIGFRIGKTINVAGRSPRRSVQEILRF